MKSHACYHRRSSLSTRECWRLLQFRFVAEHVPFPRLWYSLWRRLIFVWCFGVSKFVMDMLVYYPKFLFQILTLEHAQMTASHQINRYENVFPSLPGWNMACNSILPLVCCNERQVSSGLVCSTWLQSHWDIWCLYLAGLWGNNGTYCSSFNMGGSFFWTKGVFLV